MDLIRIIVEVSVPVPTQLVFLSGESGVGKSAIASCLVEKIITFSDLYYKHVAVRTMLKDRICHVLCAPSPSDPGFLSWAMIFTYSFSHPTVVFHRFVDQQARKMR